MARRQEMTLALVIIAVFIGILLAASASMAFMSGGMMGGGMMGGGGGGFSFAWLALIIVLGVFLIAILAVLLSPSQEQPMAVSSPIIGAGNFGAPIPQPVPLVTAADRPPATRTQEAAIVRLLEEDERQLYTLIREKGGEMLQSEIVATGSFSKAKVTRLLDKLENKDIVVRERHGMTNKVRLVTMPQQASETA